MRRNWFTSKLPPRFRYTPLKRIFIVTHLSPLLAARNVDTMVANPACAQRRRRMTRFTIARQRFFPDRLASCTPRLRGWGQTRIVVARRMPRSSLVVLIQDMSLFSMLARRSALGKSVVAPATTASSFSWCASSACRTRQRADFECRYSPPCAPRQNLCWRRLPSALNLSVPLVCPRPLRPRGPTRP